MFGSKKRRKEEETWGVNHNTTQIITSNIELTISSFQIIINAIPIQDIMQKIIINQTVVYIKPRSH